MLRASRFLIAPAVALLGVAGLAAQTTPGEERPTIHVPVKKPTRQELDRAEAVKLYALAVLRKRDNHLIEALNTFEEALRLDPEAVPVLRSLIPLYAALERTADVFKTCERILELNPDDFETGYLYARELRRHERSPDATKVLTTLAGRPSLKDSPEVGVRIYYDLGLLQETSTAWAEAVKAFLQAAAILDRPEALLEQNAGTKEELTEQAAETYEHLGRVYLKLNKPTEAIAAFEKARERDPLRAPRLSYNLAEVLISQGDLGSAVTRLDEYLRTQPQGMDGYELKIQLQRKLKRSADIVPDLEEASGRDPHNDGLKLLLAREYRKARDPGKAEAVCQELIKTRPTAEVYRELFTLCKDEGAAGVSRALTMLDEAVKQGQEKKNRPGDTSAAARGRGMLAAMREDGDLVKRLLLAAQRRLKDGPPLDQQTGMLFANLATRTRQLDLAERLYRGCLTRPGAAAGRQDDNEPAIYDGLLNVLEKAHKNQAVIDLCKQGLEHAQGTNRILFHLHMSEACLNLNQLKEALAAADAAVDDAGDKERLMALRHRALLLSFAEKHDQAITECQAMLKEYNQPGEVREIRYALSGVYSNAKDLPRSEEQLRLILEADPTEARACNDLGYLLAEQNKKLTEAEKLIRAAMEQDRKQKREGAWVGLDGDLDNAAYVDSLGWALFRQGKVKEARQELERASRLPDGSDDPVVWDHLGDVRARQGDKTQALEAWRKAVEQYEVGQRRRPDEHYRELKQKLRQAEP